MPLAVVPLVGRGPERGVDGRLGPHGPARRGRDAVGGEPVGDPAERQSGGPLGEEPVENVRREGGAAAGSRSAALVATIPSRARCPMMRRSRLAIAART